METQFQKDRQEAMKWWNNLSSSEKEMHTKANTDPIMTFRMQESKTNKNI